MTRISKTRRSTATAQIYLPRVRDPFLLQKALADAGLPSLDVRETPKDLPRDGTWLCKARQSSAGSGVEPWTTESTCLAAPRPLLFSAIYGWCLVCGLSGRAGCAQLLGSTQQLLRAHPGRRLACLYAGSIGPLRLDTHSVWAWNALERCWLRNSTW